jgi:hypothetical protein
MSTPIRGLLCLSAGVLTIGFTVGYLWTLGAWLDCGRLARLWVLSMTAGPILVLAWIMGYITWRSSK